MLKHRLQELCEGRGGCPGHPVPNKPDGFCGRKAALNSCLGTDFRSCVNEGRGGRPGHPPSLISLTVSADGKQH